MTGYQADADAQQPSGRSEGDFHTHSSRSDGTYTPTALVDLAASHGVRTLALADHDTLDGLEEAQAAAARHPGMRLIPAVEVACDAPGAPDGRTVEVHVLGLFIDPAFRPFRDELDRMKRARVGRAQAIVEALARLNAPIRWERVLEIAGEASVGRPHIARALVEAGYVQDTDEAFRTYIADDSPAYVEREKIDPAHAIDLIHQARGLAVYAHAAGRGGPDGVPPEQYEALARSLADAGLDGLEVYYRRYSPREVEALRTLADRLGLVPTGGSDFHGLGRDLETEPGCFAMPAEAVQHVLDVAAERGCTIPAPTALEAGPG